MKRYLRDLLIISVLTLVGCFLLSQKHYSDDFLIHKTIDTHYKKVAWNITLLNERSEVLNGSTVFLGSSIVQGGVNDSILNAQGIKAVNMGVPHNGNELGLYFQKRVLEKANPKKIIYLKGKIPYKGLHKLTPLLYTSSELFEIGQTFNLDYINFVFKKVKLSLEYFFYQLGDQEDYGELTEFLDQLNGQVNTENVISNVTYNDVLNQKGASVNDENFNLYLNGYLYQREQQDSKNVQRLKIWKRKAVEMYFGNNFLFNQSNQEKFLAEAIEACRSNKIGVEKLYIPILIDVGQNKGYIRNNFRPSSTDEKVELIQLENLDFLRQIEYWEDRDHLNHLGAQEFTKKIVPLL
ncbi:hypothetical protein [Flagellimonas myxillae]|uniref:hypothetical protein n=1 Tax=Flagellimonas myxillae TaxID=2942214 RepID=UPI00201EA6EE|nr:hypothetical protein [Muricauda myxillae]MCL6266240.1 hypothetical protein [Muricauda myxillae]